MEYLVYYVVKIVVGLWIGRCVVVGWFVVDEYWVGVEQVFDGQEGLCIGWIDFECVVGLEIYVECVWNMIVVDCVVLCC